MSCAGKPCAFEQAHQKWIAGDFVAFMGLMHDDIEWIVNIDGTKVPYAASAVGKEDLRWRLQHMMDTFAIASFVIESFEHSGDACHSVVQLRYVHKRTGEPLDIKVRFTGWAQDGLVVRCEERADAAYVEAYEKFVRFLEDGNRSLGSDPSHN
jgi:ketosteroid isomerase-like protein